MQKKEQLSRVKSYIFLSIMLFTISLQLVQFVHPPTDVPVTDRYGAGAKYIFPDPSLPVAAFKDEMSSWPSEYVNSIVCECYY